MPTATDGQALYQLGYHPATDKTPFENRWGGWFVTGRHGAFTHMGNQTVANPREPGALAVSAVGLAEAPIRGYPLPTSDIVALLVFEHQAETANWITRLGWHARMVAFNKQPLSQLQPTVNALVEALLFTGEQTLPTAVAGTSGFAEQFSQRGPKDKRGRSLRELDLKRYVFRYPLSYLIYSPAFEALPEEALAMVYQRLWEVLSGRIAPGNGKAGSGSRFDLATRIAIAEIVSETKLGLPPYWQAVTIR